MTLRAKVSSRRSASNRVEFHDTGAVRCRGVRTGRPAASLDENAPLVFRDSGGNTLAQCEISGLITLVGQVRQTLIPQIESVTPATGQAGGGDTVTIAGNRFTDQTTVRFNGTPAAVTFVSANELSVVTPAGTADAATVQVAHPGQGDHARTDVFTYWAAPDVQAIAPATGNPAGKDALQITGTGFQAVPTVTIGGTPATNVIFRNSGRVDCVAPAGSLGAADVVLTNPDGQADTLVGGYTYATGPSVTGCAPIAVHSGGGVGLTVTGSGFVAGAAVTLGGAACTSVVVVSGTQITCDAPALAPGLYDLLVTNPSQPAGTLTNAVEVFERTIVVIPAGGRHAYPTADGWPAVYIDDQGNLRTADQVRHDL